MNKCPGCGAVLQYEYPELPGYAPKKDSVYCRRCFRLSHYDDLTVSMKKGIDPDQIMGRIEKTDALIVWVVDLFDFEACLLPGISRRLQGKDIILCASKRDILPETLSEEKIASFVFSRLKEEGISVRGLVITSSRIEQSREEVMNAVNMLYKGRPVIMIGRANAGKSTLLNHLMSSSTLTMSRYPGTTLDFNELTIDGITFIDTPGIEISGSYLMEVDEEDLKTIIPDRTLKPLVYQLRGNQSFALGGLARLDLFGCDHASCVFYCSSRLKIHRSKAEAADALWQKHRGELFVPVTSDERFIKHSVHKTMDKMDIVFDGLGWASVRGQITSVSAYAPKNVNVTFRKALL